MLLAIGNGCTGSSEPSIRYRLASSVKDAASHGPPQTSARRWPFGPPFTARDRFDSFAVLVAEAGVAVYLSPENQAGHEPDVGLWPVCVLLPRLMYAAAFNSLPKKSDVRTYNQNSGWYGGWVVTG